MTIHSCSYYCQRPECIKAQRDELRDRLGSMTDREIMQRALEALEWVNTSVWLEDCYHAFDEEVAALRDRLAQPEQPAKIDIDYWVSSRPQIIEALAKAGFTLMSNANGFWLEPAPQPERHELQAKGTHPAPCARHCEANAFQIVIKNLEAQLAQPEQGGKTGWPAGMLQDDSRELSKALASKPDAKQHAREAAHGIKGKA